eukprot:CAMPEP_0205953824 /NCGR_PEP_ID=MMETSP1459-20131121/20350_1 /ASSEMBLY_ACC=CAM_ASM_001120 /TAXON_ID=41880 /ORGANISM="Pycnococcus provasolii, Strain RCC931" /LENGTH=307 /DNA_ID=CAMNT_0053325971 /DNA_START=92 /DNA_END=1012 /DNA_ORIENTATION=+
MASTVVLTTTTLAVFGGALAATNNAHGITGAQAAEYGGYQGGGYSKYGGDYKGGYSKYGGKYDYKLLKPYPEYANKFYGGKYYGDYGYECGSNYPQYKWYKPFTWKFSKYSKTGYYVDCHHKPAEHVEETHEEPIECLTQPPGVGGLAYDFASDMAFTTDVPKDASTNSTVTVGPFGSDENKRDTFLLSGWSFGIQFGNLNCAWEAGEFRAAKCTGATPSGCELLAKVTFGKLVSDGMTSRCVAQQLSLQLVQSGDLGAHRTAYYEPCKARALAGKYTNVGANTDIDDPIVPTTTTSSSSSSSSSSS